MLKSLGRTELAHVFTRIAGFAFLFAIVKLAPKGFTGDLYPEPYFIVFSCTHFVIAFIYSWKQVWPKQKTHLKNTLQWAGLLASVIIANVYYDFLLMPTFLAHHILTEAYINTGYRFKDSKLWNSTSLLSVARVALETSIIIALTYKNQNLGFTSEETTIGLLFCSYVAYLYLYVRNRKSLGAEANLSILLPSISFIAASVVIFSPYFPEGVSGLFVIGYHGFVWIFIPMIDRKTKTGLNSLPVYLLLHVIVISLLSWWVYSYSPWEGQGKVFALTVFSFSTFFHNFHSLFVSNINPRWVIRWTS